MRQSSRKWMGTVGFLNLGKRFFFTQNYVDFRLLIGIIQRLLVFRFGVMGKYQSIVKKIMENILNWIKLIWKSAYVWRCEIDRKKSLNGFLREG